MASRGAPVAGPDFVCIGMAKAGTGWLFDQLNSHPDFWMPPIKGLSYLHKQFPKMSGATRGLMRSTRGRRSGRGKRRSGESRDYEFLKEASACRGQPRDLARYAALFRFKDDLLSGDITPTYVELTPDDISQIAKALPDVKIILLVRDPVARAASRLSMAYRNGDFDAGLLDNLDVFREFVASSIILSEERSRPSQIVARWAESAPNVQFRYFLFDDIENEPEKARREILLYLGADPDKRGELTAGHNHKSDAVKLVLPDSAKAILVEYFQDEVLTCAGLFGGQAANWVTRYGLSDAKPAASAVARGLDARV